MLKQILRIVKTIVLINLRKDTGVDMLTKKDWKEIIYFYKGKGRINETQLFKELADYSFLMEQASKVYCHFTGLSKTNHFAETIISEIEERTYDKKITQDDINDIINSHSTKKELIEEIKKYFND